MESNQTTAAAELKKKLMPLLHAIQSEVASQVMKDPNFKFDFKTVIDDCRIEVNFPHAQVAVTVPEKAPRIPTNIPLPTSSGSDRPKGKLPTSVPLPTSSGMQAP